MNSSCISEFWDRYNALPESVRADADRAFDLWKQDTTHPSLFFKPVKGTSDWWSVRVNRTYRALCIRSGEDYVWFFIGNHEDYMRLIP